MFLRTLILLFLVGCEWTPLVTDTHWKVAEHMCRNNDGPDTIQLFSLAAEKGDKMLVKCKNGMFGEAKVISKEKRDGN